MNIQNIMRGLPLPVQGLLMQAYGATANQQPQQNAGGGRGFVNPPLVNPNAAPPQMPRVRPSRPVGVPKDEAGFEDVIARIMAGDSTDEWQNTPAVEAPTPVQAAMQPDLPAPAAQEVSATTSAPQVPAGGEGLLSRFGFEDGNQAMGAIGAALAAAGSADPAKTALSIQAQRGEEAKIAEARRQRMVPKIVGSAGPNGAIQLVQMPDGRIVPQTLDQVMQMNTQMKTMDFKNDVEKAIAIETAKDKLKTGAEDRKSDRESATDKVQAGLSVQQLNQIADSLEKTDTATGPVLGLLPKVLRDVITPQGASLQDSAERIVQGGLRATLGGQFTQAEGDRFLARAYNPRLDEKQNATNMRVIAREIAAMQLDKKNALDYFQKNGTLGGFVPNANPGASAPTAPAPAAPAAGGLSVPGLSPRASRYFQ